METNENILEETPVVNGKNIGTIGDFEAENLESGVKILNKCEEVFKTKKISFIVGPMTKNTWKKYRTIKF